MNTLFLKYAALRDPLPPQSYLNSLPAVQYLQRGGRLAFDSPITFLVGENGTGKSTLLEALAVGCGFNAEGGTRNFSFSTAATHSPLWQYLTIGKGRTAKDGFFLRAESFYNAASYIDELERTPFCSGLIDSYGGRSLHSQSHGESFLALVQNRFHGGGLYFLDEPEAALSPARQLTLLALVHGFAGAGAQFVIATHSPILMACPGALLYELTERGIAPTSYQDTEHYRLTLQFLQAPQRMLDALLAEDEAEP